MSVHLPVAAEIVERIQESRDIFTLRLRRVGPDGPLRFDFAPGQFNMVYLRGAGEVAISIVSDPDEERFFDHTIRAVGRVTDALAALAPGDRIGIRGPFGTGWPLREVEGRDVLIVTGGLGCAPVVSVINYLFRRRAAFGRIAILQGVRHAADMIWRPRYDAWAAQPDTEIHLAADVSAGDPGLFQGTVVELFKRLDLAADNALAMLCGPEVMMAAAVAELRARGFADAAIYLSLERNMQCGNGLCGHCQFGPLYVCRDGPVFAYSAIADWFGKRGF
ncbi:MAG: FAD/NAD(P)-binding protein [Gammaproteobacteria bacterium]|nr:FAD/NAD(P)-binding protein [Gammaproteobacteria bacterium]